MITSEWRTRVTRPQSWLILAVLSLMIMELSLASLWYQAVFKSVKLPWLAVFSILGFILLASYALVAVMQHPRLSLTARQALFFAWLLLAMLGSLRVMVFAGSDLNFAEMLLRPVLFITLKGSEGQSFYHLLLVVLVIWRGVTLARSSVTLRDIQISFQLGLILLMIYGMSFAPSHPIEAATGLYLYLFFAMTGMSAVRIASLSSERGGRVPRFSKTWFTGILLAVLGFVGLAILAGWLAGTRVVDWVIKTLVVFFTATTAALLIIAEPVFSFLAQTISGLISWISEILSRLAEMGSSIRLPKLMEDLVLQFGQFINQTVPYIIAGRGLLLTITLLLVIVAILVGLRFRLSLRRMEEEQDSSQAERDKSPNLLHKLARRLFPDGYNIRLRSAGQLLAAARIRQIYRQLIRLSHRLGHDRPPPVTPLEFLPQLAELFPEDLAGLERITHAYVRVRYGELPETLGEVNEVQQAWESIRRYTRTNYKK